ncbi:MAG: hypothetical protein HY827_03840 [Actinobacteria bacterium]|nr:hypothetical protein [Actinomycetota bacterium]
MAAMVVLTFAASVVNYLSSVVFGRMLTPASYGDYTALLALVVVVAVPTAAAQTVVAERLAVHRSRSDVDAIRYLIRHALAHVGLYSVVLGLAYCASIPLVVSALDLQAIGPALALAPLIAVTFFVPVVYGALQGLEKFVALGAVVLGVALSRIAFGVPWTLAGGGAGGPIAGQAIGSFLAIAVMLFIARKYLLGRGTGAATSGLRRRIGGRSMAASGAFIAFALLSNLDVLLAKMFLPPDEAGSYAALATIGKIVLFLPGAVSIVMVPYVARSRDSTGSATNVLRVSAVAVAAGSALVAIPTAIEPSLVLRLMFGNRYLDAASGVLPIVLASASLALLYLLVVYTVTIQDHNWVYLLLAGVGLQALAIGFFHGSAIDVAVAQASVMIVILVINELVFHPILRAERLLRRASSTWSSDN